MPLVAVVSLLALFGPGRPSTLPLGARAAAAQSNAELVAGGYHTPSHDYDLVHQRVEVGNFSWDSTSFDGRVTSALVSLRPGLDSVALDMDRRLEVQSVTGAAAAFRRAGDSIVVALRRAARFGDTVRFTIAYKGRIEHGRGLYFFADSGPRPAQIYSGGGTDGNPRWIPTYGAPHDKATWEVIATVPRRFTVVSNGRMLSDRSGAGGRSHTVHWSQERPASTYLLSLVIAPLVRIRDRWRDVPLDYFVYAADSALARPLFGMTPDVMEVYTRLTGVPFPWPRYAQTTAADFIGGMENVGATTLVDWLPDPRAYLDRPWYRQVLIPHELAHQWFGNLVTARDWAHYWLNEGMAEFMPGQYWGATLGRHAEEEYYFDEYQRLLARDAQRRVPLATYNSNVVYPKGALVLQMLKKRLGPERLWAGVHRYLARHAFGTADSDDLRIAFLDATGVNLHTFWEQWVYGAGYPEFTVSAAYDSTAGAVTLTVRQTQTAGAASDTTVPRFSTPSVFRMPVKIRVGTAAGDIVASASLDAREQTIRIDGVRAEPRMIVFDDGNTIVKRLTFDQPTRWLAAQLVRDPDLWNRWWVIEQLAMRTGDSVAAAALSLAARSADYALTRAQAASALGRFAAPAALPALEAAAHDTSAQVRTAVINALGQVGGERAWRLAQAAWAGDSSYTVRATALAALARLDPTGSRAALEAGLATDSYRDVIRSTAAAIVSRLPRRP
jgi:aminopeptidase N